MAPKLRWSGEFFPALVAIEVVIFGVHHDAVALDVGHQLVAVFAVISTHGFSIF